MANIEIRDGDGQERYIKATGAGTDGDPFVKEVSIPTLPAGTNAIGNVGVTALPALPVGTNAIGTVAVTGLPSLPVGTNAIGTVGVTSLPSLPIGANAIGTVGVTSLPTPSLQSATGTIATSGDNIVIDISAVAGYLVGDKIVITSLIIQNESSTGTTALVKDGSSAIARVLGQNQGDGLALTFQPGLELRLSPDADLIVNLSDANSFGYTVFYYLES